MSFVIFIIRTVLFPEKVLKFALGLFLNEISNFPPFLAARHLTVIRLITLKNYGGSIDMSTCFFNHDAVIMRIIVNLLKQP